MRSCWLLRRRGPVTSWWVGVQGGDCHSPDSHNVILCVVGDCNGDDWICGTRASRMFGLR
jgi:hypothetical protein